MVTGMPMFSFEYDSVCRGCALGKNTKKAYPHNNRKTNGILDLIHYDLCGPMIAPPMNDVFTISFLLMIVLVKLGFIF
jgi:hypothetical protein